MLPGQRRRFPADSGSAASPARGSDSLNLLRAFKFRFQDRSPRPARGTGLGPLTRAFLPLLPWLPGVFKSPSLEISGVHCFSEPRCWLAEAVATCHGPGSRHTETHLLWRPGGRGPGAGRAGSSRGLAPHVWTAAAPLRLPRSNLCASRWPSRLFSQERPSRGIRAPCRGLVFCFLFFFTLITSLKAFSPNTVSFGGPGVGTATREF